MTTIGKIWTASIAYVALAVGAGLSIMYNVVDTMTVRGAGLDVYDIMTAVAAPAIVVLMVELFVSNWWVNTRWPMQTLRWLGCLVIGGVAMRASWTHGHDFMARRGQAADVAITWPLAIDLLAVMATALILAGRRVRLSADTVTRSRTDTDTLDALAEAFPSADTDVATMAKKIDALPDTVMHVRGHDRWSDLVVTDVSADGQDYRITDTIPAPDTDGMPDNRLSEWVSGAERAHADIADTLAAEAQAYIWHPETRMTVGELPRRTRTGRRYPAEFAVMATAWNPAELDRADMIKLSAAYFGVSDRTARRWLAACLNEPVSGPPEVE